ncbi:Amicyanin-alpha [bacterium HR27]|nr:Amicyanin-alpha [bacterium HR27]
MRTRRQFLVSVAVMLLASCGQSPRSATVQSGGVTDGYGSYDYGPSLASPARSSSPSIVTTAPAPGRQPTVTSTGTVEIRIVNFDFKPAEVTVPAGTTLVWRNVSPTTHTVTAKDGAFDSGLLEGGKDYSVTLTQPGTYEDWCTLHPEMVGRVIVR